MDGTVEQATRLSSKVIPVLDNWYQTLNMIIDVVVTVDVDINVAVVVVVVAPIFEFPDDTSACPKPGIQACME